MWLPQQLQWMSTSSRPFLFTFGSKTEYFSSVASSGEITFPHCGQEKSPSPSIFARSILCICLISIAFGDWISGFHAIVLFKSINWFFRIIPKSMPNLFESCAGKHFMGEVVPAGEGERGKPASTDLLPVDR
jgi:hypothetical protein